MLISALCDYYDILRQKGLVLPEGYSRVGVSYLISLTPEGRIADIMDYRSEDTSGKKPVYRPRELLFPKRTEKTSIDSNFIEHRPAYIFGLGYDTKKDMLLADDSKARKSHDAFVQYNLAEIEGIDEPLVNAYRAFMEKWEPAAEQENPLLLPIRKLIGSAAYFAFCLSGNPARLLQDVPEIRAHWEESIRRTDAEEEPVIAQCAITGQRRPIARVHEKIRGVYGGQPSGTALVSFKNDAERSYGMTQSYNSNISDEAMRKYTEALNYLLRSRKNKTQLDDLTVIHWAASTDERLDELFEECIGGEDEVANALDKLLKNAREGLQETDMAAVLEGMDPNVAFYTVGLKPNTSRLAVKFIYRNRFADVLLHVAQHIEDMKLGADSKPVPLWLIPQQLISPNADKEKPDPSLMTKLLGAVVNGTAYPEGLLATLVRRVGTDGTTDARTEAIRMRMIKACINRSARRNGQKEVISVALDRSNDSPAYLCGRLFAVLESIQNRASRDRAYEEPDGKTKEKLNRTIKDAYFASASARPAVVFPRLITLAQYHLAKLDNGYFLDQEIMEILACLGSEFPTMLSLKDQGVFMLGYYQQKTDAKQRYEQYKEEKENGNQ
ncbi:MAG: type I-C CRISPR-associated protein Cas8c/Csd1 [Candidatus Spyradocola sp.]